MYHVMFVFVVCTMVVICGPVRAEGLADSTASDAAHVIKLDGSDQGRVFDGIGGLSAGANSRLLYDYPEPQRSQILDFLFRPDFGASLQVLKVEIGGTVDSTWGSEASHANTRDELEHPKPEYYNRGYEWWLMKEAKKRNPDIILETLQWGAPGWIGNGEFFSQDNADFVAAFIKGARDYHGLTISYQGLRNEAGYNVEYIKTLRKALDAHGLQDVKIVATDSVGYQAWDPVMRDIAADPEATKAVYAMGIHYTGNNTTDAAKNLGKPLWASEESMCGGEPWARADGIARLSNLDYVTGRLTKTVFCALITSFFDFLYPPKSEYWNNPGFMMANTPWSGHYEVPPAIWATAHTTQFTKPGWRYLDGGCGVLEKGSYVTLRSPDERGDYSIIIETMNDGSNYNNLLKVKDSDPLPNIPPRRLTFEVKNLSKAPVHVWRSNRAEQFVQLPDITPKDGTFTITVEGNSIYTLTTTTGQCKGSYKAIPANKPFPFPYKEDFERYAPGEMARYFSDQEGTFLVGERGDGKGKCLRQIVPQRGIEWFINQQCPWTVIGDASWEDYEVSADVCVQNNGHAGVYGRISGPMFRQYPGGYGLVIDRAGEWWLRDTGGVLESGKIETSSGSWHNLKLRFRGDRITGVIDGKTVCSVTDHAHAKGPAALAGSYDVLELDNFAVRPVKGRKPQPVAGWENLALGAKATASSQLDSDSGADKATDGDHETGWCPAAGKTTGEWLELDLGERVTFDSTVFDQHREGVGWGTGAIAGYKVQYWNGRDWKDLVIGANTSSRQRDDFSPVTAARVRLLITACAERSHVYEFGVYRRKH